MRGLHSARVGDIWFLLLVFCYCQYHPQQCSLPLFSPASAGGEQHLGAVPLLFLHALPRRAWAAQARRSLRAAENRLLSIPGVCLLWLRWGQRRKENRSTSSRNSWGGSEGYWEREGGKTEGLGEDTSGKLMNDIERAVFLPAGNTEVSHSQMYIWCVWDEAVPCI